jgi:hypothetical protein
MPRFAGLRKKLSECSERRSIRTNDKWQQTFLVARDEHRTVVVVMAGELQTPERCFKGLLYAEVALNLPVPVDVMYACTEWAQ